MKQILKWLGRAVAGVVVVVLFALLGALTASEVMLHRTYAPAPQAIAAAGDAGAVARGRHLATVYGCHDCHGADLTGRLFFDQMPVARISGANLSRAAHDQTDAQLARAIRTGVAADGRGLWIMPSEAFARLSDAEVADLIAYLRTFPAKGELHAVKQIGPVGRLGILLGKFRSAPQILASEGDRAQVDLGPKYAHGRSLSRACVECHGAELKGSETTHAPDLAIAGAYEPEDFERLLRTGVAAGGRRVGLMSESAPGRFNALSHQDIMDLHAYLRARAEQAS